MNLTVLLVRTTVCKESCLPIGWRTVIWWEKCSSFLVWIAEWFNSLLTSRNPKDNFWSSVHNNNNNNNNKLGWSSFCCKSRQQIRCYRPECRPKVWGGERRFPHSLKMTGSWRYLLAAACSPEDCTMHIGNAENLILKNTGAFQNLSQQGFWKLKFRKPLGISKYI